MSFDLLVEDWIPVLYANGRVRRVGIRQALLEAGDIRQIAAPNPMDRVGMLRFLLAVLYWCKPKPPEGSERDQVLAEGGFPASWLDRLDQQKDCFNLLGDGPRFYQDASCRHEIPKHTVNYLVHEVPSGSNARHFRHTTDMTDGLCRACCAMGLVRLPPFATSGGKGKSPGINAKPPLYVMPTGPSLLATLLLSWAATASDMGLPEWVAPSQILSQNGEVPLLMGLTWLPRSIWLGDPEGPESVCAACGRKELLLRSCVFKGKGSQKADGRMWRDPHLVYVPEKAGKSMPAYASDALGSRDAACSQWARFLQKVFAKDAVASSLRHAASIAANTGIRLSITGFATVDNDKYLEAWERHVTFPPSALAAVKDARTGDDFGQWCEESRKCVARAKPPGRSGAKQKCAAVASEYASIRPHIESRVSANASELVARPDSAWQKAIDEHRHMLPALARSLAPGFTTRALLHRNQIRNAVPDMTPRPASAKRQPKAKKGGDR